MSKFYGQTVGHRSCATRCGTSNSGIRSSVQSWEGSCITELNEYDGKIILTIDTAKDSRGCWGDRQFRGTIEEFNEAMQLLRDIKEGKVSITRHRAKSNKQLGLERAFGIKL